MKLSPQDTFALFAILILGGIILGSLAHYIEIEMELRRRK